MSRATKFYDKSPRLERNEESGKMGVKRRETGAEKESSEVSEGVEGMEMHHKHAKERLELHHKHEKEHMEMHQKHMMEKGEAKEGGEAKVHSEKHEEPKEKEGKE